MCGVVGWGKPPESKQNNKLYSIVKGDNCYAEKWNTERDKYQEMIYTILNGVVGGGLTEKVIFKQKFQEIREQRKSRYWSPDQMHGHWETDK